MDEIEALKAEIARLRAALEEVALRCRTKIAMKEHARKALYGKQ
jgi:hypothetical protein